MTDGKHIHYWHDESYEPGIIKESCDCGVIQYSSAVLLLDRCATTQQRIQQKRIRDRLNELNKGVANHVVL